MQRTVTSRWALLRWLQTCIHKGLAILAETSVIFLVVFSSLLW
jgi:hypothetical protein